MTFDEDPLPTRGASPVDDDGSEDAACDFAAVWRVGPAPVGSARRLSRRLSPGEPARGNSRSDASC